MWDALRLRLARRAAWQAVRRRPAPTPGARLDGRRLLAVLPANPERSVWDLLGRVRLPASQMHLLALGACSPPDRFAGAVGVVADDGRDWRGLPRRAVAEAAWSFRPDVALNLAAPDDPAALLLVGAAPATVRAAGHDRTVEAAYDLFVTASAAWGGPDPAALGGLLSALDPPLLPLDAPRAPGGSPAGRRAS